MRLSLRGVVAAALFALVLSGCGTETPTSSNTPVPSQPTMTPSKTPSETPSSTPTPVVPAADVTVDVKIAGGKSTPSGQTVKAKTGQKVRITAVSDVADSLHVHGYDKTLDLKPGKSVSVEFTADTKGSFEVETHESGKLVFKLQVS
ncbi:hypothetical protein OG474_45800 [Kribbella sp. NBC_01505]|uniref:hypothetical protein n=1 Tax=Kribbella sp. NBC_01505 TaxID=2903580 RepID=UPI00386C65A3